jgi:hypothetical protein
MTNSPEMTVTFCDDLSKYSETELHNARIDLCLANAGIVIMYESERPSADLADVMIKACQLDIESLDFNGKTWMDVREVTRNDIVDHIDRMRAKNS